MNFSGALERLSYGEKVCRKGWNGKGEIKGAGSDPDKKRAFALAIYQMEQSNNNHKED